MNDFWKELGLEPTEDLSAIRHAYAQRAKSCHPEESPEEFQRLHSAYESACQWAKSHKGASRESGPAQDEAGSVPQPGEAHDEGDEVERLVAAGLQEKEQKDLRRYGNAIGSLYRLYRDLDCWLDLQSWQALLGSSVFSGLPDEPKFYPYLCRFLSDHYKTLPNAAWLAIRDAFSLEKPGTLPETAALRQLVLPRCQNVMQEGKSKAALKKKEAGTLVIWPFLAMLFLIMTFRDTEHPVLLAVFLVGLAVAALIGTLWKKRKNGCTRNAPARKLRDASWFQAVILAIPIVILAALIPLLFIKDWTPWVLTVQYLLLAAFLAIEIYFYRYTSAASALPKSAANISDRVTEKQKGRVLTLVARNRPALLRRLSLPELLFAGEVLRQHPGRFPLLEEAFQPLVLDALRKSPHLFLAFFEATGTPYLSGGTAWLFTRRSFCENCIDYFSRQFLFLTHHDIPRRELEEHLNELRRQGCHSLLIDNCEYTALIPLDKLLSQPPSRTGQENPALQLACQEFFQSLTEGRYLSKKVAEVQEKEERMLAELLRARLLVPVWPGQKSTEGDSSVQFPALEAKVGRRYLPVFTDLPELKKAYPQSGFSFLLLSCDEVMKLSQKYSGFAINPYGFNLVFQQKNLARLKYYRDTHPEITPGSRA